jgi:hypothetical protein
LIFDRGLDFDVEITDFSTAEAVIPPKKLQGHPNELRSTAKFIPFPLRD